MATLGTYSSGGGQSHRLPKALKILGMTLLTALVDFLSNVPGNSLDILIRFWNMEMTKEVDRLLVDVLIC